MNYLRISMWFVSHSKNSNKHILAVLRNMFEHQIKCAWINLLKYYRKSLYYFDDFFEWQWNLLLFQGIYIHCRLLYVNHLLKLNKYCTCNDFTHSGWWKFFALFLIFCRPWCYTGINQNPSKLGKIYQEAETFPNTVTPKISNTGF